MFRTIDTYEYKSASGKVKKEPHRFLCVAVSPCQRFVAAGASDGQVYYREIREGNKMLPDDHHKFKVGNEGDRVLSVRCLVFRSNNVKYQGPMHKDKRTIVFVGTEAGEGEKSSSR